MNKVVMLLLALVTIVLALPTQTLSSPVSSTYRFQSEQSDVVQTGGFAGIHETYSIEGQFQLSVDLDAGVASFVQVDANLIEESPYLHTASLNEIFNMTELTSTAVSETSIDFMGTAADDTDTEIVITLTFTADSVHLAGRTIHPPGSADFFEFELDALATAVANPATYYVDAGAGDDTNDGQTPDTAFATIQHAIDTARGGDTVIVLSGTYTGPGNRDLDFKGKAITVRSRDSGNPDIIAATIIDCNASEADRHRGFIFDSNEGPDSILEGLTITNGYAPDVKDRSYWYSFGGGILCRGASPTISNCVIRGNTAGMRGGGILCFDDGEPRISGCTVSENMGGGIFNDRGTIINCTVMGNSSFGVKSMYGEVIDCTITHNRGVGLDCSWFIHPTVRNCIISHNQDGGVECYDSGGYLFNCIISGNRSSESGGGIKAVGEINSLVIENCVIVGNTSEGRSGAIVCGTELGDGALISNTIIAHNRNTAVAESGGYGGANGDPYIRNCLFYDNAGGDFYDYDTDTTATGAEQINAFELASANIDGDPCFASLGYWDPNGTAEDANDDFWVDGDYRLKSQAGRWDRGSRSWVQDDVTSPCIDAGDPMSPIGYEPFPNGGIVNMGAYGGTVEASKSWFDKPVCETIVAGDINGDCVVDFRDMAFITMHWLENHQPTDAPPGGN